MGDRPDYEVERGSYWRSVENRRKAGIAAAIAIAVLGVAGTLALSATREPMRGGSGETSSTITPAEETSETSAAVPSDGDDAADGTAGGPDGSGAEGGVGAVTAVPARGALVAYRREGKLCVSAEDGSGERALADSLAGVYTLSPDGGTIAYVEGGGGLSLVDVASGAAVTVGPATQDPPSWAPDSSWLVYTAPGPVVMLVPRSGHGAIQLFAGSMPVVSVADGIVVAAAESGGIAVWRGGALSVVPTPGTVTGLATDGASVWCGSLATDGSASLCTGGDERYGEAGRGGRPRVHPRGHVQRPAALARRLAARVRRAGRRRLLAHVRGARRRGQRDRAEREARLLSAAVDAPTGPRCSSSRATRSRGSRRRSCGSRLRALRGGCWWTAGGCDRIRAMRPASSPVCIPRSDTPTVWRRS